MKKILFMFFLLMILCFPIKLNAVVTNSSSSIKVNLFIKNDCKACEKAKEWLEEYRKENFMDIEYINIDDSSELYDKIKKVLSIKSNDIPLIVIGSNYFVGFNNNTKEELTEAIKSYEEVDSYCDTVSKVRNNEDIKDCKKQNEGIYNQSTGLLLKIILIVVGVFLLLGLVILIKKKNILSR